MKSVSNKDILNGSLQMFHIHVLLVATMGTGHMSHTGTDHHEGRVVVREDTKHMGATDLQI